MAKTRLCIESGAPARNILMQLDSFYEINSCGAIVDVIGSANNKAKTMGMEHVKGRKFTEKK